MPVSSRQCCQPGKRAVAVRISAENTAGGFVLPNDRVDVIQHGHPGGSGEGETQHVSRTILSNVRVLAIDQSIDERSKDNKGKDDKAKEDKSRGSKPICRQDRHPRARPAQAEILTTGEAQARCRLRFAPRTTTNAAWPPVLTSEAVVPSESSLPSAGPVRPSRFRPRRQ